ncbi:MBL fold metallo-hydrolase [Persicirhabdus sediminis]|uniref:MBL fold metallo-hydrolase n=1 Tax=Persicirhabdus sediminis TaxID=454144 RepID=A0A8J7SJU4_9BACT|nr:MBL fold metallo-hydrolase [Persicirhabdus sediminis]MBK1790360.1 MBL fold metallo-hydrolase [Persicirhabdus sediminis]
MTTFQNYARHNEIGANCYVLETGNCRIALDSGMHPKEEGIDSLPLLDEIPDDSIDAIILSHSHLDHCGSIPVLMEEQPNAPVFMTPATFELADALLHNSVNVMMSKRQELGITEYPFYTHRELDEVQERWITKGYKKPFEIKEGVKVTFYDAGHILGSAGALIESEGKRILYTGDVQFEDQTLITGSKLPTENIDTLIIETTRGASPRHPEYTREKEENMLAEAIERTIARGGSVLIPVFAMGKTQEVMTMIHKFKEDKRIPDAPVFMGGLSTKMTIIFDKHSGSSPRNVPGFKILRDMEIQGAKQKRRRKSTPIHYRPGAIFALSSGMMSEKTVSNNFAKSFIDNPKNSLLFVGYADPESPAGVIRASERGDYIKLDPESEAVKFDCDMDVFDFSGHATRDDLLEYMIKVNAKKTILVHGDPEATQWFADQLAEKLPTTEVIMPEIGRNYEI